MDCAVPNNVTILTFQHPRGSIYCLSFSPIVDPFSVLPTEQVVLAPLRLRYIAVELLLTPRITRHETMNVISDFAGMNKIILFPEFNSATFRIVAELPGYFYYLLLSNWFEEKCFALAHRLLCSFWTPKQVFLRIYPLVPLISSGENRKTCTLDTYRGGSL